MVTMNISRPWHVFAATMLFGVGAASFAVLENTIWPHYFGGQHVGSIRGAALPLTIAFSAAGAPIAGMYKDAFGTFFPVWWASLALLMAGMILLIFTPKPATPEPETPPVPVAIPG
jgi:MFS family permease